MHLIAATTVFGILFLTVSADVYSKVAELQFSAGARANPLVKVARNVHRAKRQALRFNETDVDSFKFDDATECAMKCLYAMDEKLDALFPNETDTPTGKVVADYDPAKFEQFCDAYRPGSECLNKCPNGPIKNMTLGGLKMAEIMCVTKYTEFKKNLPCMNKIGKDVEKTCDPKCEPYEHALDKLEKFGLSEGTDEIDTAELRFLFKEGCKYIQCQEDCGHPMTEKSCGKEAGDLETLLVTSAFQSVNDMMETFNDLGAPQLDFWPQECRDLAKIVPTL